MLIDGSIKNYVDKVASKDPTPGGGSVAALAGSLGSALTAMVGYLTIGRKMYEELDEKTKGEMDHNFEELKKSIEKLNQIVDEDTKAFDKVMEAFKLPKETEEEKKNRSQAIQEGYKVALEVPLRCAEECFKVLELQKVFADHGNVNAITDVGVGALLAATGLEGALLNVKINLLSIKDEEFKNKMEEKIDNLLKEGTKLKEELLKTVYQRLG
ncbi:cyclodeaminase/cyclohydrolase family protein [Schnuerera ultunensis]|uniref:Formiminotransferase-cyclodeaminase n=1 Tax=[Clostridium] ultunense Esp TaxID=1288971 RepID=A0A1M4PRD4_9FIRM|nr:cyclodeaminase/cyclohydrolase family protein [Schnuerera ultunensis]SHD78057.1 Formiminotransferase-cyclodeaminase [[Clostridium] ultunense Esp]